MVMLSRWRYFRPRHPHAIAERRHASLPTARRGVFVDGQLLAEQLLKQHPSIDDAIDTLRHRTRNAATPERLLALTLLMVPRSARAQEMMDAHKHNFHDRKARLFELIDFNDTFVATVLALRPEERVGFGDRLYSIMRQMARRYHTPNFLEGQYEAIVHGLSREIAVYQAALDGGFDALMSSRTDDAFGIDMQIRDRRTGHYINIDIKTHSSYYFRLKVLVRERRISQKQAEQALDTGYCSVINRSETADVHILLFRIDHTILGDIVDFAFTDTTRIIEKIHYALDTYGIRDDGFGKVIASLR